VTLENFIKGSNFSRRIIKLFLTKEKNNLHLWLFYVDLEILLNENKRTREILSCTSKLVSNCPKYEISFSPYIYWKWFKFELLKKKRITRCNRNILLNILLFCIEGKEKKLSESVTQKRIIKAKKCFVKILKSQDKLIWKQCLTKKLDLGFSKIPPGILIGLCYCYLVLLLKDVFEVKSIFLNLIIPNILSKDEMNWGFLELIKLLENAILFRQFDKNITLLTLFEVIKIFPNNFLLLEKIFEYCHVSSSTHFCVFFEGLYHPIDEQYLNLSGSIYLLLIEIRRGIQKNKLKSLIEKLNSLKIKNCLFFFIFKKFE